MELLIRSQQKGWLGKVEDLRIMKLTKNNFRALYEEEATEGWNIIVNDDLCIGTYNTKERALEVLDDIQLFIKNNCCFIENMLMGDKWEEVKKYEVFEMPKE